MSNEPETTTEIVPTWQQQAALESYRGDWLEIEAKVKELYAPGVSDLEWEIYKGECQTYGLSPVKREYIPLMIGAKREGKDWVKQYRGYLTLAGMIALAERSGRLDAIEGPHWAGAETNNQFVEFWAPDWKPPLAARATVWRTDKTRGTTRVVTMARANTKLNHDTNRRELTAIWKKDPAMMLGVRAVTDALKQSGILAAEPMERLATDDGIALEAGDDNRAGRRIHAIGAGRNLDHDDIRTVAQNLIPGTNSLADLAEDELRAVADVIDLAENDDLADLADRDPETITGDNRAIAPEPDPVPSQAIGILPNQLAWLDDHKEMVDWRRLGDEDSARFDARQALSQQEAANLILAVSRALRHEDWDGFWQKARKYGLKTSTEIQKAAGFVDPWTTYAEADAYLVAALDNLAAAGMMKEDRSAGK